ncbi:YciI family protein [Leeia sp.]|uniref:YciI family protein n=1 Tax=Leeia sp. TaxID=2884678 RepID=UPI0035B260D4
MFLIDMTFVKPLDEVDRHVQAHRDYLAGLYAQGLFLLGGRKQPRSGGIILSRQQHLDEVKAVFDADPLVQAGVATYTVTAFEPVMRARVLEGIL